MPKCPFCNIEILRPVQHLKACNLRPEGLTVDELKVEYYKRNFGTDIIDAVKHDYVHNLYSLPMIKEKYGLSFRAITFILTYSAIQIRNMSESQRLISAPKSKKTCLKKYGVNNPSQCQDIKNKKARTFINHYGVDNIWKTAEYAAFTSRRWKSYTSEEKNELLNKCRKKVGRVSLLERRVLSVLSELQMPIVEQFKFHDYYHKYDFLINGTNIIFEINGDFWHANPNRYNATDTLRFSKNIVHQAQEIWKMDEDKISKAKEHGYEVIILWESEIKSCKDDNELGNLINDKIENMKKHLKI